MKRDMGTSVLLNQLIGQTLSVAKGREYSKREIEVKFEDENQIDKKLKRGVEAKSIPSIKRYVQR